MRRAVRFEGVGHVWIDPPDAPRGEGPSPLLLAVHGYGQPVQTWRSFARSVAPDAVVATPEGPSDFYRRPRRPAADPEAVGHGWIAKLPREPFDARNDAYLLAAIETAREAHPVDPGRVFVMGFSQGVGVALHFALGHAKAVAGLVGLAGGLARPYRARLAALRAKPVLWVTGTRDAAYPPDYAAPLLAEMREAGLDLETHELDAPHDLLDPAAPLVDAWWRRRAAPER